MADIQARVTNTVRAQSGSKNKETTSRREIVMMMCSYAPDDPGEVREALQAAIESGDVEETDEGRLTAEGEWVSRRRL